MTLQEILTAVIVAEAALAFLLYLVGYQEGRHSGINAAAAIMWQASERPSETPQGPADN